MRSHLQSAFGAIAVPRVGVVPLDRRRFPVPRARLSAEVVKVVRAEINAERALLLEKTQPSLAEESFEIVQTGPTEVAIVSFDGEPKHLVNPNTTRARQTAPIILAEQEVARGNVAMNHALFVQMQNARRGVARNLDRGQTLRVGDQPAPLRSPHCLHALVDARLEG